MLCTKTYLASAFRLAQKEPELDLQVVRDALIGGIRNWAQIAPYLSQVDCVVFSDDVASSGKLLSTKLPGNISLSRTQSRNAENSSSIFRARKPRQIALPYHFWLQESQKFPKDSDQLLSGKI